MRMKVASIREVDGSYEVRWREGRRHPSRRFSIAKLGRRRAKTLANAWKLQVETKKAEGGVLRRAIDSPFLDDVFPVWLGQKEPDISSRTFVDYARLAALHITPQLGDLRLIEIRPATIMDWQKERFAAGAGPRRIQMAQGMLQQFFSWCVLRELVDFNPVREIRQPKAPAKPVRSLTVEEVEAIRTWFLDRDDLAGATLISVLAYAGTRSYSETFALHREDVVNESLVIRRGIRTVEGRIEVHDLPKTGTRVIQPPAPMMDDLHEWLDSAEHDTDIVFHDAQGRYWHEHDYLNFGRRGFRQAWQSAGIEHVTPYGLRHSCGSQRVKAGDSLPEVAAYLGNSVEICARHYLHDQATMRGMKPKPVEKQIRKARR